MNDSAPKSRLPRTGTLVLIAVVLLIGSGVLMVWLPYHRNQTVIAEVERLGGFAGSVIVRPAWIPDFVDDEYLTVYVRVTFVDLINTQVTDAELQPFERLSNLKVLYLDNTQVGDAGLKQLREITSLDTLTLGSTQISNAGLEYLRGLSNLDAISLDDTQVSDAGLEHLRGLTNLYILHLDNTQVSDAGLHRLDRLQQLTGLYLLETQVTEVGVKKLQKSLPKCVIEWEPSSE